MWQWLSTVGKKNKNGRLLWLQHCSKKKKKRRRILFWLFRTIYLMGTQSATVAYRITVKSQRVKVRLPLNLKKHERGPRCINLCASCLCSLSSVCVCVRAHQCIMCRRTAEVRNNCDPVLLSGVSEPDCVSTYVRLRHESMSVSRKVRALAPEHVHPLMNVFGQIPGITANPGHRPIPQCNASGLNVKKSIT